MTDQPNQCMGCQAGWPRVLRKSMFDSSVQYYTHPVVGGYPHESVECTRYRYRKDVTP